MDKRVIISPHQGKARCTKNLMRESILLARKGYPSFEEMTAVVDVAHTCHLLDDTSNYNRSSNGG